MFVTHRVNKLPIVLAFLGAYYLLFTVAAFAGDPRRVAEIFRPPDLHMALFFAFFMLTDKQYGLTREFFGKNAKKIAPDAPEQIELF